MWILIILSLAGSAPSHHVEFATKGACFTAKEQIMNNLPRAGVSKRVLSFTCVEK